jgi:hypothetical protein
MPQSIDFQTAYVAALWLLRRVSDFRHVRFRTGCRGKDENGAGWPPSAAAEALHWDLHRPGRYRRTGKEERFS